MVDHSFTMRRQVAERKKLSSEERIKILCGWEASGLDGDVLAAEISSRTGVPEADVYVVLIFEDQYTARASYTDEVFLEDIAQEIGNTYQTDDPNLKGVGHITEETAMAVLECEDEIFWEIGINVELDEDSEEDE